MSVPTYDAMMLPLLRIASDGLEHSLAEAFDLLAKEFELTEEDRKKLLPSGRQHQFENRVGWARTYLKKAGLIETPGRGRFRMTERGRQVLAKKPRKIDYKFLMQFPEFAEFKSVSSKEEESVAESQEADATPEEALESSYLRLRQGLAQELLDRVKKSTPQFFETLVIDLLVAMGYGGSRHDAGQALGRSGDGGIDGMIKEDRLGLDVVYVQAKRWEGTVGRPIVQAFAGSLEGVKARKGVVITTSRFSEDAIEFANRIEKRIVLIDGPKLVNLMIDHGIGVTAVASYEVNKVDLDYFGEDE